MKTETEQWLKRASEDMGLAEAAWEREYYAACVAHCQQAIEKVLKGSLVEAGIAFRKTHDLLELADNLHLELDQDQRELLARLTEEYKPSRYGDVYVEYPREVAENYLVDTRKTYQWLLQLLK